MIETSIPKLINKTGWLAIRALNEGVANERQQKIALLTIIDCFCKLGQISFEENNQYKTAFNEGRKLPAILLKKAILFEWDKYEKQMEEEQSRKNPFSKSINN